MTALVCAALTPALAGCRRARLPEPFSFAPEVRPAPSAGLIVFRDRGPAHAAGREMAYCEVVCFLNECQSGPISLSLRPVDEARRLPEVRPSLVSPRAAGVAVPVGAEAKAIELPVGAVGRAIIPEPGEYEYRARQGERSFSGRFTVKPPVFFECLMRDCAS